MKQKLLYLLLLTVALVTGSSGAWGDELSVNSSESAYVDSSNGDTNFNGASQTNLKINNTQFRDWGSAADGSVKFNTGGILSLYKFDLTTIKAITGTIQSIEFSVSGVSSESGKTVNNVRLIGYNPAWSATTITSNTLTNSGHSGALLGTVEDAGSFQPLNTTTAFTINDSETTLKAEALTYVNSAIEAEKDYVSFAVAANHGRVAYMGVQATLTVKYTNASATNYTLKAVVGTEELGTIASGSEVVGVQCTVNGLPKVLSKDNKYYILKEQTGVSGYTFTFTKGSSNETLNVEYELAPSIAFFTEAEALTSNVTGAEDNGCSGNMYGYVTSRKSSLLTTLIPGKYTATGCLAPTANKSGSGKGNGNRGIYFRNEGTDNTTNVIAFCPTDKNSPAGEYTTEAFVLMENTPVLLSGYTNAGDQNRTSQSADIDYLFFTRIGDAPLTEGIFLAKDLDEESDVENLTISEDISATTTDAHYLNSGLGVLQFSKDGTLTLKSEKEGFGFTKITFNASSLNCSASTGSISNGVWTGNASEVTFTFNGVSNINSILIGNSTLPALETATTIAEFKAGAIDGNEMKLVLDNAEILRVNGGQTIFQDATGGIATYINIEGAQVGKTLSGSLSGVYVPSFGIMLMDGTQTNFYTAKVSNTTSEATAYTMTVEEAIDEANAYRIVTLKGVSISEEDGKFYATDKTGESILIQVTPALADYIKAGDVLASLTGFTSYGYGNGNSIEPRTADDIVSGLIWQGDDLENGSPLNADLTSGDILEKMAELKAGDEIHIELMSLNNVELEGQGTPLTISTAAGKTIYTIYLKEENLQEGTVSFPITQDVVREINKHGMTIEADANVTIVYVEPGKYDAEEEDIWLSDETAIINGLEIGDAHFKDVRESDVVELEAADDLDMTIENYGETEEYISGDELSDEQAALLQDGKLIVEAPATGLTRISFYKNAVRDDKAEVTENEDGTYDSYKQGEKGLVNGMIMTFGGNDPEGAEYEFAEVYPEVNKFGSATEGIDQLPVDNDGKAFDKKQNNLPTKGTYYVFEPTKNGTLEITAGIEAGKTIVFAEEGGEAMVDQADDDYEGMNAVEVEATKTYYLFSPDSNL